MQIDNIRVSRKLWGAFILLMLAMLLISGFQQYRANSVANAQNGAAAAAGTANTLAGGYGADWAKTAANQAAGEQIAGVDNSLSSLRADALQNWKQKMSDTTSVLDDLLGQQSLERSEYDGSVSNAQNWRDYLSGRVDTARQENSDFWNNVWNVVKGVGNAVRPGTMPTRAITSGTRSLNYRSSSMRTACSAPS